MTIVDFQPAAPELTRPYWQNEPCPAWCAHSDTHSDDDEPGDRAHQGRTATVILTLEAPDVTWTADHEVADVTPARIDVVMAQHYRETGPRILVSHNQLRGFYLTPAEAARLSQILADFSRQENT